MRNKRGGNKGYEIETGVGMGVKRGILRE